MLNFKRASAGFLILLLCVNLLKFILGISGWFYLVPAGFLMIACGIGSFNIQWSFYFKVINKFKSSNAIVLTFDDGPHPEVTPKVLDVLKSQQVPATFFCIGKNAEAYPELVKRIVTEEHTIGNHSYSHDVMFGFFTKKRVVSDLELCSAALKKITNQEVKYFRPPFGVTNPNIKRALKKLPLNTIGWSLRTLDTVKKEDTIIKRLSKIKSGDIVLFHDRIPGIENILNAFIEDCKQKNIQIIPLPQALNAI
jgi:peptidoglycan/xylan/chitin deacetylase (PgdA/CDA1 family)